MHQTMTPTANIKKITFPVISDTVNTLTLSSDAIELSSSSRTTVVERADGLTDGVIDGVIDGAAEGIFEGEYDGDRVVETFRGRSVGSVVGPVVGSGVGSVIGPDVGQNVLCSVDWSVITVNVKPVVVVGSVVGDSVALAGIELGSGVGDNVG